MRRCDRLHVYAVSVVEVVRGIMCVSVVVDAGVGSAFVGHIFVPVAYEVVLAVYVVPVLLEDMEGAYRCNWSVGGKGRMWRGVGTWVHGCHSRHCGRGCNDIG